MVAANRSLARSLNTLAHLGPGLNDTAILDRVLHRAQNTSKITQYLKTERQAVSTADAVSVFIKFKTPTWYGEPRSLGRKARRCIPDFLKRTQ